MKFAKDILNTGFLRSLDVAVLIRNYNGTILIHTSPEVLAMLRLTLNIFEVTPFRAGAIATALSLAFTPLAAQETNCDGWVSSDRDVTKIFWKAATAATVADCLSSGSDVSATGTRETTPLHNAARLSVDPEVLNVLLNAGADVNARADFKKSQSLIAKLDRFLEGLFPSLVDEESRKDFGDTPLHNAAGHNENPEVLNVLLDAGADGTAVNGDDETPLDLAKDNEALAGTDAYWALNDARFE